MAPFKPSDQNTEQLLEDQRAGDADPSRESDASYLGPS
jgi:hypothetical protein